VIPETTGQCAIRIRLRRWFAAPREKVFRAWTNPEALKTWWCPSGWTPAEIEIDLSVAGKYRIGMRRGGSDTCVSVYGRFLEVQMPERLVYTWRWENAFHDMPETRVTVQFVENGSGTEVVLIHENLPEVGVCLRHRAAWIAAWNRMEELCLKARW
jgi:uncharacterized protein YndB with AHSA1/START domain